MAPSRNDNNENTAPDILKLICTGGPCEGSVFSKASANLTVGRTSKSKLWIKDASVSEKHAKIVWKGSSWQIQDVGSSNGTSVNGAALAAEGDPVELKDGDIIVLGEETKLRAEIVPSTSEEVKVEDYIQAECTRIEQRLKARLEQLANDLRERWQEQKQQLMSEVGVKSL